MLKLKQYLGAEEDDLCKPEGYPQGLQIIAHVLL